MKKAFVKMAAVAVIGLGVGFSQASFAKDSCATVLCMYGAVTGQGGGSSCRGPISDYFKIIKFDWKGIDWKKTYNARASYLNSCPASGISSQVSKINSKYGRAMGL